MGTNELNFIEPQQKTFTMSVVIQSKLSSCGIYMWRHKKNQQT